MKTVVVSLSVCWLAAALPLSAELQTPTAGVVRYRSGDVHPLYGLGSTYVAGPLYAAGVVALASSDHLLLYSNGKAISLADEKFSPVASIACTEQRPVLGVGETVQSSVAYLPSEAAVLSFDGQEFIKISVSRLALRYGNGGDQERPAQRRTSDDG